MKRSKMIESVECEPFYRLITFGPNETEETILEGRRTREYARVWDRMLKDRLDLYLQHPVEFAFRAEGSAEETMRASNER